MSYEEIDKSTYGTDVFTNGAEGRYAKAKSPPEKKKRAPKIPSSTTNEPIDQPYENGHNNEVVKTKKKTRKTHNEDETFEIVPPIDGETVVKPKKKRAPKVETNNENIDPIPLSEEQPVKKKKSKAPKSTPINEDSETVEISTFNEFELSIEAPTTKVKKSKKHKTPKTSTDPTTDTLNDIQTNDFNEYTTNSEFNNGTYDSTVGDVSYDTTASYPTEAEQIINESEKSEYERGILDAYNNLASKMNFAEFVGNDQWCIIHLPKSARNESKSRIRKILPGGKDDRVNGKFLADKITQKSKFLNRLRSGIGTLVRDENNLIFGEQTNNDMGYYEEEDDIDTDDLHRYAQKLRELEDTDREINPEFLVLRDGKTVYAVHEADAEGKVTFSARKPIYDRFGDQAPDDEPEKKKLLSRLRNTFNRNKDKDNKGSNSPKLSNGTPDSSKKRSTKKSTNKTTDNDMATTANSESLVD